MSVWQEPIPSLTGAWLIGVQGRLDHTLSPTLEATLNQLLAQQTMHLLVDLAEVTYINSGGLRCLVSAWRKAQQQGSSVTLCGLNGRLQEIFGMVGFDRVFVIYPSRAEAQAALHTAV